MLSAEELLRGLEQAEVEDLQAESPLFAVYQNGVQSLAVQDVRTAADPEAARWLQVLNTTLLQEATHAPNFDQLAFTNGVNTQELWNPAGVFHASCNPAMEALSIPRRIGPSMISMNMSPARQTLQLLPQSLAEAVLQPPSEWSIEEVDAVASQEVVQKSVLTSRDKLKSYSRSEWNTANKLTPGGVEAQDTAPTNEFLSSEYHEQSMSIFTDKPRLFEQLPRFIGARAASHDDVKFFNADALVIRPQVPPAQELPTAVGAGRVEKPVDVVVPVGTDGRIQTPGAPEKLGGASEQYVPLSVPPAVAAPGPNPGAMTDFNTMWGIGKFQDLLDDDDDDLLDLTVPTLANVPPTAVETLARPITTNLPQQTEFVSAGEAETKAGDLEEIDAVLDLAAPRSRDKVIGKATRQASELEHGQIVPAKQQSWAMTTLLDNREFDALRPRLVLQYPFELDDFQKQAIMRIERKECIFVAAHTSAGKTVVAEYAIATARSHMTRAIYTSPIKALSNQKYRDFKDRFEDVGIITGDVSVNPEASCLIMTTEILRSMLYRGADLIKDIEWVIFDEVHYVNDVERGVVWEEVIIMLPDHVNMIFLSATTPNTVEFSDWIGRIKRKPVYVISTPKRPVPLQHFLYSDGELFKIMDHRGAFSSAIYDNAVRKRREKEAKPDKPAPGKAAPGRGGAQQQGRGGQQSGRGAAAKPKSQPQSAGARQGRETAGSKSQWISLVNLLRKSNLLPVVVFSFSKKKCEECADALQSVDLLDNREKSVVHRLMADVTARLTENDARLSQVLRIRDLLLKGVGVHHGGLLPILKEMVEILFAKGVVKVLFATETFAMGVNMPARTVVFNGIRKHDGKDFRDLLPGEYTQMAGRAGRRGLDRVGTVILTCWSDIPPATSLRVMLTGAATKLQSQFRLTYNMILNLLRAEDMSVEDMIKRSFSEFHTQRALGSKNIPEQLARLTAKLEQLQAEAQAEEEFEGEWTMQDFYQLVQECRHNSSLHLDYVMKNSKQASSVLSAGRVVLFSRDDMPPSPALILQSADETEPGTRSTPIELKADDVDSRGKLRTPAPALSSAATRPWKLSLLVLCPDGYTPPAPAEEKADEAKSARDSGAVFDSQYGRLEAVSSAKGPSRRGKSLTVDSSGVADGRTWFFTHATGEDIVLVSARKRKVATEEVLEGDARSIASTVHMLEEYERVADLPGVDAVRDYKLNELDFVNSFLNAQGLQVQLLSSPFYRSPKLVPQYALAEKIGRLQQAITYLRHALSSQSLTLFPDFQQRLSILHRLGYADPATNTVGLKGRVACEINTCEELIATEMIFENVLEPLNPPEAVAILSALVFQEKGHEPEPLTTRMEEAKQRLIDITMGLGQLQFQAGLPTNAQDYCKHLNFGLAHVVYLWATKAPFSSISELTTAPAGSIVRCITRLDELCRDVRNAARVIGNPSLYRKMEDASLAIRRDIVFAASLYIK